MAITYPRDLPDVPYRIGDPLKLMRFVSQSQSGNRLTNVIEYADPCWIAQPTTVPMYEHEMRVVEAWWDSLRDGLRTVLFRSPSYLGPRGNRLDYGPAQQAGTVASITGGNVVGVTGVLAALALGVGDYVSFLSGARRALGRVSAVSGAGTTRSIEIEPGLPSTIGVGAMVFFDRACLLMRPVAKSFDKTVVQDVAFSAAFQLVESAT
jgi:hypothetical protein